jgi:hypothetical protein
MSPLPAALLPLAVVMPPVVVPLVAIVLPPVALMPLTVVVPPVTVAVFVLHYHADHRLLCSLAANQRNWTKPRHSGVLGWQCCRHVGDMSAQQPNIGTFGQHGPVVPTQN